MLYLLFKLQTSWLWILYTILLSCHTVRGAWGKLQPCEVETGQTNIIMDMEESRGDSKLTLELVSSFNHQCIVTAAVFRFHQCNSECKLLINSNSINYLHTAITQNTSPPELPIYGDPEAEIALELVFPKGKPMFTLNGKMLQLLQPLDRDAENLSHIVFQVSTPYNTLMSMFRKSQKM